jgi:hypothetical protein
MKTDTYKLKVTFLTPVLGSQPGDPELASAFIAKKKGMEYTPMQNDELLPEALEKGTTTFHRVPGNPFQPALMNYQLLGFMKEAGKVLNGKVEGGVKALRSKVEQRIAVSPRVLPLVMPAGTDWGPEYLERPLRAETMQGPRVTLARSEIIPEGTYFECGLEVIEGEISEAVLRDLLDYGYMRGLGQWRNSGAYGTFRYQLTKEQQ